MPFNARLDAAREAINQRRTVHDELEAIAQQIAGGEAVGDEQFPPLLERWQALPDNTALESTLVK